MDMFDKYVGQVFDGRYRIIKIIGIGGMAVVFEALDIMMRRTVAVKMLKEDIANDIQSVKRFINESRAVSMLSHPNIVSIYDVSVKENLKYIVMERVDGITLKNYINKKGPLNIKEALSYTDQILRALEHAHSKGIIHRDIKPQNIMLLKNGKIKVTDFGIAKLPNAETVTMTDKAIGTVFYISPEQASGQPIDPRSDLYSLGIVMFEMLTGKLPFTADSPVSVALMQVNTQPTPPRELMPTIPIGVEQIILTSMEKNPDNRFQSANQMLRHIAQIKSNPNYVFKTRRTAERKADNQGQPGNGRRNNGQSRSMLPIISGVTAAFLIVIGISAVYVLTMFLKKDEDKASKAITIPNFIGNTYSTAFEEELESTYYNVLVDFIYDAAYEPNTITSQSPDPGERRKVIQGQQPCDLNLVVSLGAETVTLPDLTILEYRSVKLTLRSLGLVCNDDVDIHHEYNDTVLEGYVIRTDPPAGTVLTHGAAVTLYVSRGQEIKYVMVPNFVGMTEKQAMKELTANELGLGKVTYEHSDKPAGVILAQSKTAYSEVPSKATRVDFVVSLGPEE